MKALFYTLNLLGLSQSSHGKEDIPLKWKISIPVPLADSTLAEPVPPQEPIDFTVQSSHTKLVSVTEAPERSDLPPVERVINVTVQRVQDPGLPIPPLPPPLYATIAEISGTVEQMEEFQEKNGGTSLDMFSATVYDPSHTLLTISPNGTTESQISAWSNVDFNDFNAFSTLRVSEANGAESDVALLIGIGNEEALSLDTDQPETPKLTELPVGDSSFSVIEDGNHGEAVKIPIQPYDLHRKEGVRMEAAFHTREKAHP